MRRCARQQMCSLSVAWWIYRPPGMSVAVYRTSGQTTWQRGGNEIRTDTHVALLEQLELLGTLHLGGTVLAGGEHLDEALLDRLGHVLGVTADVNVRALLEDERGELLARVPDEVLDVDLACNGVSA